MTYHLTSRHICDDSSSSALRKALDYGNVKSALNVDNRCKESMSSLSSSSSSSNSTQRTPVTSSLPGGSDNSIFGSHMYNCGNRSNKFLLKEKVFNPHAAKHSSGPIKADHSINITSNNFLIRKEKHGSLKPIPRQKSCSLSDLSICNTRSVADTDMKYADDEKSGQTDVNQHRSNSLRSFVSDMRTYSETFPKKVEETLRNSLKSKALLNQRSCENQLYQPFEKVVDSVKNFSSLVHDKLPVNVKSNRQYCSLSDLNTNTKNDVRIVGSLNCELVGKNEAKHDNEKRNGVCINLSKSAAVKKEKEFNLDDEKRNFPFGRGLVGLQNLGNTCFMNSILQCLCKTNLLREYFWKKQYQKDLNEDHAPTRGRLAKAFGRLMNDMWSTSDHDYITPSVLKAEVQKYAVRFSGYHQQDAQEFLRFFIEGIHDDLNSVKKKPVYSSIPDESFLSDRKKSDIFWERYLSREKSRIQDLFVGQLKSTLTCTACEHRSVTYDPFWDLSLPIPAKTKMEDINITRCFRVFTQDEVLDGDEKPTCEKCKKRRKCMKRFLIEIFPNILVIHLKRFSGTRYRTKLDSKVNFPFELNLSSFAANSHGNPKICPVYSLYAISNHMGGTHGGHYTAYCKHPDSEKWHVYNDSRVCEIPSNKLVSSSAYVLFYELVSNGSCTG